MSDEFRKELDGRVGVGGIKCHCCGGPSRKWKKKIIRAIRKNRKQKFRSNPKEGY